MGLQCTDASTKRISYTTTTMQDSLDNLNQRLKQFAQERDWEQFHSPKNISMALIAEAAELVEHFQWLTEEQSYQLDSDKREEVAMEMADILIFLIRCSERLDINLVESAYKKITINEERYPAEKVRGDARRASEYGEQE
jgi:NTP pyrophosphatase (non-canonical NTP hydrolase)